MMQNIYFVGFMGSGKTYWGRKTAEALNCPFFDLDQSIEEAENKTVAQIFEELGEPYFRKRESEILAELTQRNEIVLSCGGGTPLSESNRNLLKKTGTTIWLNPPIDVLFERLKGEKKQRPLLSRFENDVDLYDFIVQKTAERMPFYRSVADRMVV